MLFRSNRRRAMEMTSIDSTVLLLPTYKVINTTGFPEATRLVRIINHTKWVIFISYDGVTDHDYLSYSKELEIMTPLFPGTDRYGFSRYTKVYVRGLASVGKIYVMAYY